MKNKQQTKVLVSALLPRGSENLGKSMDFAHYKMGYYFHCTYPMESVMIRCDWKMNLAIPQSNPPVGVNE